jgi:hypothetical protein
VISVLVLRLMLTASRSASAGTGCRASMTSEPGQDAHQARPPPVKVGHHGVEHPGHQQDDQEVHQDKAAAGPRSNWPTAIFTRSIDRKVVELPGPPPVTTKGSV